MVRSAAKPRVSNHGPRAQAAPHRPPSCFETLASRERGELLSMRAGLTQCAVAHFYPCESHANRLSGEMIYGVLRPEAERLVRAFVFAGGRGRDELCAACIQNATRGIAPRKPDCIPLFLTTRAAREAMRARNGSAPYNNPRSCNSRRKFSGMARAPGAARSRSRGASFGSR